MQATYLAHHGVKGMKWGVRRTPEQLGYDTTNRGSTSYAKYGNRMLTANGVVVDGRKGKEHRRAIRAANKAGASYNRAMGSKARQKDELSVRGNAYTQRYNEEVRKSSQKSGMSTAKKVAIGAAVVGSVALAAYGGKKYHDYIRSQNMEYHRQRGELLVAAYKNKNAVREFHRQQNMDDMTFPTNAEHVARFAREHDAKLESKVSNRIRGYESRQAEKDTFRQARKNVVALKNGMSGDSFDYKRNYGTNRESYNNYVRGHRLVLAERARETIKKRGKLGPGGRYSPKKTSQGKNYLRSDQGLKNLKANGIDPKRMGLM